MGIFFEAGQKMIRPGVYQRYENIGLSAGAGALNGIAATVFRANWGPIGEVVTFDNADAVTAKIGSGGATSTVAAITELFTGGASLVHAVRLGTGGTKAKASLMDAAEVAAEAITINAKYAGSRALRYAVREVLGEPTQREFMLVEGSAILEKILFTREAASESTPSKEADELISAINANSLYIDAVKALGYTGNGELALVAEKDMVAGTDPASTNSDYSLAFQLLEALRWNTISVDTDETSVHLLLGAFMNRVYREGKMGFALVGEPVSVKLKDRMSHAKAYNDYNVIYVGGGWKDVAGTRYEGWKAAARIAGMVAAVPSSESLTHRSIFGATEVLELLTNSQYEEATQSGMIAFSVSSNGVVWIENAITTLVSLSGQDDEGWKKIKRAKVRFELMTRVSDTVEPMIGVVINSSDGQANVIKTVKGGVLLPMVSEKKLLQDPEPEIFIDPNNLPQGDSVWFIIRADDADAIEKAYFVHRFRYSPNLG